MTIKHSNRECFNHSPFKRNRKQLFEKIIFMFQYPYFTINTCKTCLYTHHQPKTVQQPRPPIILKSMGVSSYVPFASTYSSKRTGHSSWLESLRGRIEDRHCTNLALSASPVYYCLIPLMFVPMRLQTLTGARSCAGNLVAHVVVLLLHVLDLLLQVLHVAVFAGKFFLESTNFTSATNLFQ